tara:strand:+ start:5273 stop:5611 length:339 start_codon:yes stop_codon:yes gene_type:complete
MTNIVKKVAIQFIKGEDEKEHPEIRLFRNNDGRKGQAIYKFNKLSSIRMQNFKSIQKMYLIDEEGELSTRKINLSISESYIKEVKSTYSWNSEKEFERFMRFAQRYYNSILK